MRPGRSAIFSTPSAAGFEELVGVDRLAEVEAVREQVGELSLAVREHRQLVAEILWHGRDIDVGVGDGEVLALASFEDVGEPRNGAVGLAELDPAPLAVAASAASVQAPGDHTVSRRDGAHVGARDDHRGDRLVAHRQPLEAPGHGEVVEEVDV